MMLWSGSLLLLASFLVLCTRLWPNLEPLLNHAKAYRPGAYLSWLAKKTERAGYGSDYATGLFHRQMKFAALGIGSGLLLLWCGAPGLFLLVGPFVGFLTPLAQLNRRIKARQREIILSLPYYLDLLTLALEAGLDLIAAVQEIVSRDSPNALKEELIFTLRAIQVGQSRSQAFERLGLRTGVEPLSLLASAVQQSEALGSSLGGMLRLQADSLRREIFRDAEERAQRAPLRMLMPLVLCIFPVVFILLFAPLALHLFLGR